MPFDQTREAPFNREDHGSARAGRRSVAVDPDFSWSEAPEDRHSLAHRRHSAREADDWGLTGDDAWETEPERAPVRALSERDHARRERSARAARDGFAGDWEEEYQRAGSRAPDDEAAGPWEDEHRSAYDWAREFDSEFGQADAEQVRAHRIESERSEPDQIQPAPEAFEPAMPAEAYPEQADAVTDDIWEQRPSVTGSRRTVVITGRGAEYGYSPRRRGWEASLPAYERSGFKPDRLALWAVLLGVILLLVATTSSHAATLAVRLPH